MSDTAGPTISDIEHIAALPDAVLRNLQITQCYHELALALKERTGGCANWCTFATWASKQAGQTVRKEDFTRTFEAIMGSEAAALQAARDLAAAAQQLGAALGINAIMDLIWKAFDPEAAFARASQAVARGNLKVFAEIGREFARFHVECLSDPVYDAENIARFCGQLRPGEPPDGQRYLRQAFMHYYQALFTEDNKARTELMLLGDLEIGFHEQTRLQPEINEALSAPVISPADFAHNLLEAVHAGWGRFTGMVWFVMRLFDRLAAFDTAIAEVHAVAQREAQYIITETMLTIEMPTFHRLRLGDDLVASFPPILQQITNPDLLALLAQIDPTPDSTRESGADYWGDLTDRMHFITDMFRCYAVSPQVYEPPFTSDQIHALKEGRLPAGRL